jgi:hypothetical protein
MRECPSYKEGGTDELSKFVDSVKGPNPLSPASPADHKNAMVDQLLQTVGDPAWTLADDAAGTADPGELAETRLKSRRTQLYKVMDEFNNKGLFRPY